MPARSVVQAGGEAGLGASELARLPSAEDGVGEKKAMLLATANMHRVGKRQFNTHERADSKRWSSHLPSVQPAMWLEIHRAISKGCTMQQTEKMQMCRCLEIRNTGSRN